MEECSVVTHVLILAEFPENRERLFVRREWEGRDFDLLSLCVLDRLLAERWMGKTVGLIHTFLL